MGDIETSEEIMRKEAGKRVSQTGSLADSVN